MELRAPSPARPQDMQTAPDTPQSRFGPEQPGTRQISDLNFRNENQPNAQFSTPLLCFIRDFSFNMFRRAAIFREDTSHMHLIGSDF
jgi:hypothetical protein